MSLTRSLVRNPGYIFGIFYNFFCCFTKKNGHLFKLFCSFFDFQSDRF